MKLRFRGYDNPVVTDAKVFYGDGKYTVGNVYKVTLPGDPDYPEGFPFKNIELEHVDPNTSSNIHEKVTEGDAGINRSAIIKDDEGAYVWEEFIFFDLVEED